MEYGQYVKLIHTLYSVCRLPLRTYLIRIVHYLHSLSLPVYSCVGYLQNQAGPQTGVS